MNNTLKNLLIFATGAAIGSVVTWKLVKTKYEQIAQEEIDSAKKIFSQRKKIDEDGKGFAVNESCEEASKEYSDLTNKLGYSNSSEKEKEGGAPVNKPYVIPPEEFGNMEEYDQISLTYYADQLLADEDDELVEDVENAVGFESLTHFGEYEDDSVYVRNDRRKIDYEILLDQRKYSDVRKNRPRYYRPEV